LKVTLCCLHQEEKATAPDSNIKDFVRSVLLRDAKLGETLDLKKVKEFSEEIYDP